MRRPKGGAINKRSVRDLDLRGKRVLVRVDFNVPVKDGQVTDDTRIQRALPTIRHILSEGGRPILVSHLGRPKGEPDPTYAMDPVAERLEELLGERVLKLDEAVGPEVETALDDWAEQGVVLLENSRFYPGETKNDPELSDQLASLADLYVDDAFGAAHRAHATTVGVAERLEELLGEPVLKLDAAVGPEVEEALDEWDGSGVVLLENSRFYPGETKNDPEFSDQLAAPFDLYVDDAFGAAHRAHATTVGVAERLPAAAGLLLEEEVDYLDGVLEDPERPFVAILGGAKVSDKLGVIRSLLGVADTLLVGGAMCFTFFKAQGYEVGNSLVEEDHLEEASRLVDEAGEKLVLPMDVVVADEMEEGAETEVVGIDEIPAGKMGLDIGPRTVELFEEHISGARTIFWNGPMGVFEIDAFAKGTEGVARAVARASAQGATSVIGGGDSVAAVAKLGLEDGMSHISTGGGASLEYVEGKELPGVSVLPDKGN
ncbi:MAG: phosphoglycerate kinase [Actinomycetota bacterium]|nr:phosphoglycerate kinase [Actinomycetota bacterium]